MGKWEMVQLEDVCEILDAQRIPITASKRVPGKYPYYGANGVQDYINDYIFDDELVLLAEDGGNFGSKVRPIAYRVSGKCWVNNHAHVLKAKKNIDVDYLCYSIMFYNVSKIISGSTRQKLNQAQMRKMLIPLQLLDEQRRIAQTLDAAAELLRLRKQQLAELDALVKSRFVEMFGDPVTNSKGWEAKKVEEVCSNIYGGGTPSKNKPEYYQGNIPWVTPKDMKSLSILDSIDHISALAVENSSTKMVPPRSLLMVIRSGILKRQLPVAINQVPVTVNQDMKALITNEHLISVTFLLFCFIHMESTILKGVRAVTADNIEFGQIKKLEIPLPPLSLQTKFADFVHKVETSKALVQQSIDETQALFDSLMSEYFE